MPSLCFGKTSLRLDTEGVYLKSTGIGKKLDTKSDNLNLWDTTLLMRIGLLDSNIQLRAHKIELRPNDETDEIWFDTENNFYKTDISKDGELVITVIKETGSKKSLIIPMCDEEKWIVREMYGDTTISQSKFLPKNTKIFKAKDKNQNFQCPFLVQVDNNKEKYFELAGRGITQSTTKIKASLLIKPSPFTSRIQLRTIDPYQQEHKVWFDTDNKFCKTESAPNFWKVTALEDDGQEHSLSISLAEDIDKKPYFKLEERLGYFIISVCKLNIKR
jgi:hypothetical protein